MYNFVHSYFQEIVHFYIDINNNAVERFEKYKSEGSVMKKKYLNKEIGEDKFTAWINNTKYMR